MKKNIFFLFILLWSAIQYSNAQQKDLIIEFVDEQIYKFSIDENPIIRFDNDKVKVVSSNDFELPVKDFVSFYFQERPTTSLDLIEATYSIQFISESKIQIKCEKKDEIAQLYNSEGKIIETKSLKDGCITIDIPKKHLVYLLKIGKQTFKVIAK